MSSEAAVASLARLVGCLLLGCAALPSAALGPADSIRLAASVLKIEVIRQQGGYSLGSGVVVADQRVVTNCHVTRDARQISVLARGARWPVQAQAVDARHDLCVLQVAGLPSPPIALGRASQLGPAQTVIAIGYTGGLGLQSSEGEVVGLYRFDGAPVIQSSNWFSSGASGGGLLDDQQALVGILTYRMRGGEAHYFSAPVEWIEPLLADASAFGPVQPIAADQLAYWQQPLAEQPEFLQAATLSRSGQWVQLRAMASRWTSAATTDPQAWFSQGQADEALDQPQQALESFERAVSLDPVMAAAWFRLGMVRLKLGLADAAREAVKRLEPLSPSRAAELASQINAAGATMLAPRGSF